MSYVRDWMISSLCLGLVFVTGQFVFSVGPFKDRSEPVPPVASWNDQTIHVVHEVRLVWDDNGVAKVDTVLTEIEVSP